eukprot:1855930-Pyramimonas_sp.AAC.1
MLIVSQRQGLPQLRPPDIAGQPPDPIPMGAVSDLHVVCVVRVGDERVVSSSAAADAHGSIARALGPRPIPCVR